MFVMAEFQQKVDVSLNGNKRGSKMEIHLEIVLRVLLRFDVTVDAYQFCIVKWLLLVSIFGQ